MTTEELLKKYMACGSYSDIVLIAAKLADEVRRLKDENDLLASGIKKELNRNSELIAIQCNNITATVEATEQPTLRDQFAMQALSGVIVTPNSWDKLGYQPSHALSGSLTMMQHHATIAYQYADAMMEARK